MWPVTAFYSTRFSVPFHMRDRLSETYVGKTPSKLRQICFPSASISTSPCSHSNCITECIAEYITELFVYKLQYAQKNCKISVANG